MEVAPKVTICEPVTAAVQKYEPSTEIAARVSIFGEKEVVVSSTPLAYNTAIVMLDVVDDAPAPAAML